MKWAVITGASSGFGEEFAWQLAVEPMGLVLVARREERLRETANAISQTWQVPVEVLPADLSTPEGVATVQKRIMDTSRPVGLLVNNAGGALGQRFLEGNLERETAAVDLMIKAVLQLSWTAARTMMTTGGGAIINMSSASAYTAMGTYATHKTWVRFFTEALAGDLRGTNVSATAICPGFADTEFHEAGNMDADTWPSWAMLSAKMVVTEAIEGARRRKVIVTPSVIYKATMAAARLAPRAWVRAVAGPQLLNRALK